MRRVQPVYIAIVVMLVIVIAGAWIVSWSSIGGSN